jgi:hypothetical protein
VAREGERAGYIYMSARDSHSYRSETFCYLRGSRERRGDLPDQGERTGGQRFKRRGGCRQHHPHHTNVTAVHSLFCMGMSARYASACVRACVRACVQHVGYVRISECSAQLGAK